jgi:hypothetical protein
MEALSTRPSFEEQVQSLPPELYNRVLELTFTAASDHPVLVTKAYKPPSILSVSRESRNKLVAEYYSDNTFEFLCLPWFITWFSGLKEDHRAMVKTARFCVDPNRVSDATQAVNARIRGVLAVFWMGEMKETLSLEVRAMEAKEAKMKVFDFEAFGGEGTWITKIRRRTIPDPGYSERRSVLMVSPNLQTMLIISQRFWLRTITSRS